MAKELLVTNRKINQFVKTLPITLTTDNKTEIARIKNRVRKIAEQDREVRVKITNILGSLYAGTRKTRHIIKHDG